MKERFLLAVSAATFAWTLFIFCILVDSFLRGNLGYMASNDGFFSYVLISPAIWLVLWIVTGSPRILPWKK